MNLNCQLLTLQKKKVDNKKMNIKEEIKILLLKKNMSMRQMAGAMNAKGFDVGSIQNLSNKFRNKTIRFEEVQEILDFLNCELKIVQKP